MKNSKFLFMTGGVLSGLGKGVSVAALAKTLKARGYTIFIQKFDPYYNIDPGTLSPYQHGEVFVTVDGGETDLDLGHYERFTGQTFTKDSNYTQGKLLQELIGEERKGTYGGKTIQVVPHVTNKIIHKLETVAQKYKADFIITEIGGTVGDIESQPFLHALWEFTKKHPQQTFLIHCSFLPYLETSEEFKSKPTQHSVRFLNASGLTPNMILLRSNYKIPQSIINKVEQTTFIDKDHCIPIHNIDNIYKLPIYFEKFNFAKMILKHFNMQSKRANLEDWKKYIHLIDKIKHTKVEIGMVGKYIEFEDAYKSIVEAINISGNYNHTKIKLHWISSSTIDPTNIEKKLKNLDGIIILPGFGKRGFEGKVLVANYTRQNNIPTLGICYGFQAMVVVQAKIQKIPHPTSSEIDKKGTFVIDLIMKQKNHKKIGGTLRLGLSKTILIKGSRAHQIYQKPYAYERHRHRYEVNPNYVQEIQDQDFIFSGFDEKNHLVEICELKSHPFYIGTQAHPEFEANPLKPHPLFEAFIKTTIKNQKN